jgi:hypothetical protein
MVSVASMTRFRLDLQLGQADNHCCGTVIRGLPWIVVSEGHWEFALPMAFPICARTAVVTC